MLEPALQASMPRVRPPSIWLGPGADAPYWSLPGRLAAVLECEAQAIADEDLAANRHMGELGAALIAPAAAC
jgi:methylthioribose-1-phosphate isomerase